MSATAVLGPIDHASRVVSQVLHVLTGRLETLMPTRSKGLHHGAMLGLVKLREQLGPALLNVKLRGHSTAPLP